VFCWLFLLGTGWNLATATDGMDVSDDDNWCEIHPMDASFRVLHAFKGRPGKHVFVPCLAKPEWHPYQIIELMIKITAPLRRTVLRRLHDARLKCDANRSPEALAEVAKLESMARSPWLYHMVNKAGEIVFAPEYAGNPLVNVMCVGLVRADQIFRAGAEGVGNPVFYVGNKTGRDGIHGATMSPERI
jgi:hypothetical protein